MGAADSNSLCLECGLCCNGVIFADVQLEPQDDPARLETLHLLPATGARSRKASDRPVKAGLKFLQPCAALDGCRCRIYGDRPRYCREFECVLLQNVKAGRLQNSAALRTIRVARQRAEKVKQLLCELGDADEQVALRLRFRRMQQRLESTPADEKAAEIFSRLTLAVHDLNRLLSDAFYPGD